MRSARRTNHRAAHLSLLALADRLPLRLSITRAIFFSRYRPPAIGIVPFGAMGCRWSHYLNTSTTFADLGLAQPLLRAISDAGYEHPTPIQAQAIPQVMQGHDLLAAAQTGTGKTAGFTLPILHRLLQASAPSPETQKPQGWAQGKKPAGQPRSLILAPTRELVAQVEASVRTYGVHTGLRSLAIFGGVNINPQINALRRSVDILVATPGRLLDHLQQKTLNLSRVEVLVLDEADRMLDMGFIRDIRKILALLPARRQNLLFSATFSDDIRNLAQSVLHNPMEISVAPRNVTAQRVSQTVVMTEQAHKRDLLSHIIRASGWHQVLVFTRTKHGANRLAEKLNKDGLNADALHGNKSQAARMRALNGFKTGKLSVLVATDIAARGLDIDQLPQVVNFELPNVPEDYVHRIGRTGRAEHAGAALSLVDRSEVKHLNAIERLIKQRITRSTVPGWTPDPALMAQEPEVRPAPPRSTPPRKPARTRPTTHGKAGGQPGSNHNRRAAQGRPAASRTRHASM